MGKKTGLGEDPLSWIEDTSKGAKLKEKLKPKARPKKVQEFRTSEVQKLKTSEVSESRTSEVPKFQSFEVKLSILLREDQLETLDRLTREIMANRDSMNKRERVTKNTILRACIDALKDLDIDKKNIPDEAELLRRIKERIS
jgi:hypothetical protein